MREGGGREGGERGGEGEREVGRGERADKTQENILHKKSLLHNKKAILTRK